MKNNNPHLSYETLFVHAGEKPDPLTGAVAPPLIRTKTYKQSEFGKKAQWEYARGQNPTRHILQEKLAAIEGGGNAIACASGLAAEALFFLTLAPGDHLVLPHEVYGGTLRLLKTVFTKYGISFTQTDFTTRESILKAVTTKTKYLFMEALTNPSLTPIDLALVQSVSRETGIPFIADMTFTPPCTTRAFDYGAYAVIQSISKYLAGHNDVLGGAVITRDLQLYEKLSLLQRTVGPVLSPDECYRAIQGIKTLELRWRRVSESALKVASFLETHSLVKRVLYPGLTSHKDREIASKQMRSGYGGVISFELASSPFDDLKAFIDEVQKQGVITYGESLASPETLLAYPFTMSHGSLSPEEKCSLGISPTFFRLSIGFEAPEDIIAELERGLHILSALKSKEAYVLQRGAA